MAVIVGDPLGDPKSASVGRTREIPRTKLDGTEPFHVPNVKEFVGDGVERFIKGRCVGERPRHYDLSRSKVFHTVARVTIVGKVEQKRIRIKLGRSPHHCLGAYDLLDRPHERGTLVALAAE